MTTPTRYGDIDSSFLQGGKNLNPSLNPSVRGALVAALGAIGAVYADTTAMQASLAKHRVDGQLALKLDTYALFVWKNADTTTPDSTHIKPTDVTNGRFVALSTTPDAILGRIEAAQVLRRAKLADGSAGAATAESVIGRANMAGTISKVYFVPTAALTGNGTNNATLTVRKRDGAGGAAAAVASLTTTASWSAFQPVDLGTITNGTLLATDILTFEITKAAGGVVVPDGEILVVFTAT